MRITYSFKGVATLICLWLIGMNARAGVTTERVLPVKAVDVVYGRKSGLLYLGVRGVGFKATNIVMAVSPNTGETNWSVPVAVAPGALGLSDDETYLYVGSQSASSNKVVRFILASRAVDLEIPMPRVGSTSLQPTQILPLPGQPKSFAVLLSRQSVAYSIAVFDETTQRPNGSTKEVRSMALSEDGGTLFVSGTQNKMYKYAVGPQGLTLEQTATLSTLGNFVVAQGRLMTSSGEVYDTATWARLGLLRPLAGTLLLAPVPEMKRIWATSGIGGGPVAIYTHSTRIRSVLPPG